MPIRNTHHVRRSVFTRGLPAAWLVVAAATSSMAGTITLNFQETVSGVTCTYGGTLDSGNLSPASTFVAGYSTIFPSHPGFVNFPGALNVSTYNYVGSVAILPFGTGGILGAVGSGDSFAFTAAGPSDQQIGVSASYVWGSAISGAMDYAGKTFATLGVTPGTYTYDFSPNSIIVNVGSSPVPEIDPVGMGSVLALVASVLGLLERRRLKVA